MLLVAGSLSRVLDQLRTFAVPRSDGIEIGSENGVALCNASLAVLHSATKLNVGLLVPDLVSRDSVIR